MNWLTPLGFLGLLGIVALILIYIIKPTFQTRFVSSTYVWKLSLRYRRRRIPVSFFRNFLILLCQILIITACALMMASPVLSEESMNTDTEKIVIIDASGSMQSSNAGSTRFSRAVVAAEELAEDVALAEGTFSVIVAGSEAYTAVYRGGTADYDDTVATLKALSCGYGEADIDGAMELAEDILIDNPEAEVILYTGTTYPSTGNVTVVDVSNSDEWNAAILNASVYTEDNYYRITVSLACYGRDDDIPVTFNVYNVNGTGEMLSFSQTIRCSNDETVTTTFSPEDYGDGTGVTSYSSIYIFISEEDSITYDNSYYIYGGEKTTIKLLYCSSGVNSFFSTYCVALRSYMEDLWNIEVTTISDVTELEEAGDGFDFYIFEHEMPEEVPKDGVVILFDLDSSPAESGIEIGSSISLGTSVALTEGSDHEIMDNVTVSNITVSQYTQVQIADGYETLMFCGDDPVMLLKDTDEEKIVVFMFSVNFSNIAITNDFSLLFLNIFNYYFPSTFSDSDGSDTGYVYNVDETFTLNGRGTSVTITGPDTNVTYTELPSTVSLAIPGTYTAVQTLLSGNDTYDYIFVKLSSTQSNIWREEDILTSPYTEAVTQEEDTDLMIYFAIAMVALLFVEWWLQAKENF